MHRYAIECLKESKFSFSADVWSFGVTLYEIVARSDPPKVLNYLLSLNSWNHRLYVPVLSARCYLFLKKEIQWNDKASRGRHDFIATHQTAGEKYAITFSQGLPTWGKRETVVILLEIWVTWYIHSNFLFIYFFYQQVKLLMDQCWAADPKERPSFSSLIEKLEDLRRTYDWQPEITFAMA